MKRIACLLITAWLAAAATVSTAEPAVPALKAGIFEPPHLAPQFSLRGSDGSELTLRRYRGKLVLLSFGFTHCAAVCPTTLATLAQARKALGPAADAVQVLFVTVDPERDDLTQLKRFLAAFDSSFVGVSGRAESLAAVRKSYGVVANKVATGSTYAVDHTSSTFLIDREGRLRAMMPYGRNAGDYVHDIQRLLAD